MRRTLLAIIVLSCWVTGGERVYGCSCMPSGPPCEAPFRFEGVFVGRVESLTEDTRTTEMSGGQKFVYSVWRVRMRVSEVLRGEVASDVDVFTSTSSSSCGYDFVRTRTYLVYAYREKPTGRWAAGICSRTRPVEQATEDLSFLRASRRGEIVSTLRGKAERQFPVQEEWGRSYRHEPYPGLRIDIEALTGNDAKKYQTTTNPAGEYTVQVPVGRYRLTPVLPPTLYVYGSPTVDLRDATGCVATDFVVQSNGRIGGRVLDSEGRPVPYLSVEIARAEAVSRAYSSINERAVTDVQGNFEFSRLEPDRYRLGLDLREEPRQASQAIWFMDASDARPFDVLLGTEERVWTREFVLPASVKLTLIAGVVIDENGKPVPGARTYLREGRERRSVAETLSSNTGEFRFNARAGRSYQVLVEVFAPNVPFKRAESELLEPTGNEKPLVLQVKPRVGG